MLTLLMTQMQGKKTQTPTPQNNQSRTKQYWVTTKGESKTNHLKFFGTKILTKLFNDINRSGGGEGGLV